MFYTYFDITNFKGIKHLVLDLTSPKQGRIHTLVGLNESGKTTILEAIDLFSASAEDLDASELAGRIRPNENDLVPIAQRANFNGTIKIKAGIHLDDADVEAFQKFLRKEHGYRASRIARDVVLTDEYTFANSVYQGKVSRWTSALAEGRKGNQRKNRVLTKSEDAEVWNACIGFARSRLPAIWYFPNFLFDFPARIFLRAQANENARDRFL